MKAKAHKLFIHTKTGDVVSATKTGAKKLSKDYKEIEFTENDQGKQVARVRLEGVTIDISEREAPNNVIDGEVIENGDTSTN